MSKHINIYNSYYENVSELFEDAFRQTFMHDHINYLNEFPGASGSRKKENERTHQVYSIKKLTVLTTLLGIPNRPQANHTMYEHNVMVSESSNFKNILRNLVGLPDNFLFSDKKSDTISLRSVFNMVTTVIAIPFKLLVIAPLRLVRNILKLGTEFLPNLLTMMIDNLLFNAFYRFRTLNKIMNKSIPERLALVGVGALVAVLFTLKAILTPIKWLGRAFTSPFDSIRIANTLGQSLVIDPEKVKEASAARKILAKALGFTFAAISFAISATMYVFTMQALFVALPAAISFISAHAPAFLVSAYHAVAGFVGPYLATAMNAMAPYANVVVNAITPALVTVGNTLNVAFGAALSLVGINASALVTSIAIAATLTAPVKYVSDKINNFLFAPVVKAAVEKKAPAVVVEQPNNQPAVIESNDVGMNVVQMGARNEPMNQNSSQRMDTANTLDLGAAPASTPRKKADGLVLRAGARVMSFFARKPKNTDSILLKALQPIDQQSAQRNDDDNIRVTRLA